MTIRHPEPAERGAILDLIGAAFPNPRAFLPEVREAVASDPDYADERTLVAVDGGRVVGHVAWCPTHVALAGTWLPVTRFGSVCVAPEAQRHGVGRQLMQAAMTELADATAFWLNPADPDYVRRFYESLGFVAARRTRSTMQLKPSALAVRTALPSVGPASPADVPALNALYERHYAPGTGAKRRTADWWQRRVTAAPLLWSNLSPRLSVAREDGHVSGYCVTCDDRAQLVWELAGNERSAVALLRAAAGQDPQAFAVAIPPTDPLRPLLTRLGAVEATPPADRVMVRAQRADRLMPVLAGILAAHGARLNPDGSLVVAPAAATLQASPSHWLALVYDGGVLEEWVNLGTVTLAPPTALALAQRTVPARAASRRATDAF